MLAGKQGLIPAMNFGSPSIQGNIGVHALILESQLKATFGLSHGYIKAIC